MDKPVIVIDLDGVIATGTAKEVYSNEAGWRYENCTLVEGSVEGLKKLSLDYKLILSTARWGKDKEKTIQWLKDKEILHLFDEVQVGVKPSAKYYIDDRALRFTSWKELLKKVGEDNG